MNISEDGFNMSMNSDESSSQNNQNNTSSFENSNSYQSNDSNINSHSNSNENIIYVPGYNGTRCSNPVKEERFEDMMESVEDASFAEDKVRVCKRILKLIV